MMICSTAVMISETPALSSEMCIRDRIGADAKIAAESAKQNFFTEERILAEENKIEKEEPQVQEVAVEDVYKRQQIKHPQMQTSVQKQRTVEMSP